MSSTGRPETRVAILDAARTLFEEQGYFGAGLEAVAKRAGVSRQAIYLHFSSKADLLTALHARIYETDVVPAVERHPIWTAPTALDALDATIAVDAEVAGKVWRIHEALVMARRHHAEVAATLRPREDERYQDYVRLARWLKREGALPAQMRVATVADILWGLLSLGTFQNLVIERSWSTERFTAWVRTTVRAQLTT
ncbi:TetR/AcrR family transcriptional regulator [Sporichthya sp.]|uniref:TetR/AcrR family transcriptional regulator n=1 Tax=Sporichthya sp. TaxID=65475 RepID=UPI00183EAC20|nr:TetR/AcrR family transcriptional regulator [Sporichthya sp.]MBA3744385.1 TetR/AcrR family transcriptional regulator [Sporichthya sp.]